MVGDSSLRERFGRWLTGSPDRWLVLALCALYFSFPLSKTLHNLPLLAVVVLAFVYGQPSQWWRVIWV